MLEPFGCKNEKPILMLEAKKLVVQQMKDNNFRHFKLQTVHGKSIVAFSAEKHVDLLKSSVKKHLILDLENNEFKGKVTPQAILKNVYLKEFKLEEDKERECILSLISKYYSDKDKSRKKIFEFEIFELENILKKLNGNGFGTLVVVDSYKMAERLKNIYKNFKDYKISHSALKNKQNIFLITNRAPVSILDVEGYENVVFTRKMFNFEKNMFADYVNVYVPKKKSYNQIKLIGSRNVNVSVYNLVKKYAGSIKANNIFEWVEKIQAVEGGLTKAQIMFSCLAFDDLGFIKITIAPEFNIEVVEKPPKKELSSSRFMSSLADKEF